MAASIRKELELACKVLKIDKFREFQEETIQSLIRGRDVFLSVKTGEGKSVCYQAFPVIWQHLNCTLPACRVLVVTPLITIMKEQCEYLTSLGFRCTYIGKDREEEAQILKGDFDFLFSSPELLLGVPQWREMLSQNNIQLMVVDEAHTVLHWGESDGGETPFRAWYGKLGEARSLLTCPLLLITATANKSARKKVQKKFSMIDCCEIIQSPDRANIKLFVHKVKSTLPLSDIFEFLLTMVREKKGNCDRYLIFCPSIKLCSNVFTMFRVELESDSKHVQMFHSMTTDKVKEEVRKDMSDSNGTIRILVATSAAGMGVNFSGVNNVINFGPPRDMDSFVQQFGRCGRDGSQAMALLLYNAKQCRDIDQDMQDYISNTAICRREIILNAYNAKPSLGLINHLCCDICSNNCVCQQDCSHYNHPIFNTVLQDNYSSSCSDTDCSDSDVQVSGEDV